MRKVLLKTIDKRLLKAKTHNIIVDEIKKACKDLGYEDPIIKQDFFFEKPSQGKVLYDVSVDEYNVIVIWNA